MFCKIFSVTTICCSLQQRQLCLLCLYEMLKNLECSQLKNKNILCSTTYLVADHLCITVIFLILKGLLYTGVSVQMKDCQLFILCFSLNDIFMGSYKSMNFERYRNFLLGDTGLLLKYCVKYIPSFPLCAISLTLTSTTSTPTTSTSTTLTSTTLTSTSLTTKNQLTKASLG